LGVVVVVEGRTVVSVAPVPLAGVVLEVGSVRVALGGSGRGEGERGPERGVQVVGPGPGFRDFDLSFALAADDPYGGVQDAVAQGLGLGVGQGSVEAEQA